MTSEKNRLLDIASRFRRRTVLVVGDLMLDEWIWGRVSRISPEAPVPVVQVEKRTFSPGGASNVAANVRSLGARTIVAGLTGDDEPGKILRKKLKDGGVDLRGLVASPDRQTTLKTRIIAHSQQLVRADFEAKEKLNGKLAEKMNRTLETLVAEADAILFSDYNKGCVASLEIPTLIRKAVSKKKAVIAGPKPANAGIFSGATLIVLNQGEAEQAVGFEIKTETDLKNAGKKLLDELELSALYITRGEHGLTVFEPGKKMLSIPAQASQVYDVSGAGDTVIAVAALAVASGASFADAAILANHAAGVVVRKVGTATVSPDELKESL